MTDDDLWFPDHLEHGLAELRDPALGLAAFRSIQVRFPDVLDPYFFAYDWRLGPPSSWLRNWFMGSVGCVHRRSVFQAVGYWNEPAVPLRGPRVLQPRARVERALALRGPRDRPALLRAALGRPLPRCSPEPPQKQWLPRLQDPEWREGVSRALLSPRRGWDVRRRQAADFMEFGARSGPKFVRFLFQKLTSPDPARA